MAEREYSREVKCEWIYLLQWLLELNLTSPTLQRYPKYTVPGL
jgi:hypothetical protein